MSSDGRRWLTVADICAELRVSEDEWAAWQARGETPLHLVGADGQLRVRADHLDAWFDALPSASTEEIQAEFERWVAEHPDDSEGWWQ